MKRSPKAAKGRKSPRKTTDLKIDDFLQTFTYKNCTVRYGNLFAGHEKYGDKDRYMSEDGGFYIQQYGGFVELKDRNFEILWPGSLWNSLQTELKKLPYYPIDEEAVRSVTAK